MIGEDIGRQDNESRIAVLLRKVEDLEAERARSMLWSSSTAVPSMASQAVGPSAANEPAQPAIDAARPPPLEALPTKTETSATAEPRTAAAPSPSGAFILQNLMASPTKRGPMVFDAREFEADSAAEAARMEALEAALETSRTDAAKYVNIKTRFW